MKVGDIYNSWQIQEISSQGIKCLCLGCNETIKIVPKYDLITGRSKSCGCLNVSLKSQLVIGKEYNNWILLTLPNKKRFVECKCILCSQTQSINYLNLLKNNSLCKCQKKTRKSSILVGSHYGNWVVLSNPPGRMIDCKCICGTIKKVDYKRLLDGDTTSCGCKKAEKTKESNISKYGVECTLCRPHIRKKRAESSDRIFLSTGELFADILNQKNISISRHSHFYQIFHKHGEEVFLEYLKNNKRKQTSDIEQCFLELAKNDFPEMVAGRCS